VELAGALGEIARDTLRHEFRTIQPGESRIVLVDAVERVLPVYPPELSEKATHALNALGVDVWTKTMVTEITGQALRVKREGREESIESRTILWAAGVQASPLGKMIADSAAVPVEKGGRLAVGPDLTLPGHPDILVIGDLAQCAGSDGKPLPGVAPVAIQEGHYAGRLISGRLAGKTVDAFHYKHYGNMATIGRAAAVADLGWLRFDGALAWLAWLLIHLMYLVGFEDRLLVLTQWAWNYLTRNRGARLITGNEPSEIEPHL
jgi:NADH dehydrogenase